MKVFRFALRFRGCDERDPLLTVHTEVIAHGLLTYGSPENCLRIGSDRLRERSRIPACRLVDQKRNQRRRLSARQQQAHGVSEYRAREGGTSFPGTCVTVAHGNTRRALRRARGKTLSEIRKMRMADRVARARPFEVVESALPRLQLRQGNLKERRCNADQEGALDGIGIPTHVDECRVVPYEPPIAITLWNPRRQRTASRSSAAASVP